MLGYAKKYRDRVLAEGIAIGKAEYHQKILEWESPQDKSEKGW